MTLSHRGPLFRALNPMHAREPLSGAGAALHGGRFNPRSIPALYTSLTVMTALREANQVGSLQPTVLVSYEAEIERVFDTRDAGALKAYDFDASSLADTGWRDRMKADGLAPTQDLARRVAADGFHGLLVHSFAKGASARDINLVLWAWGGEASARLTLIDDEDRLSRSSLTPAPSTSAPPGTAP